MVFLHLNNLIWYDMSILYVLKNAILSDPGCFLHQNTCYGCFFWGFTFQAFRLRMMVKRNGLVYCFIWVSVEVSFVIFRNLNSKQKVSSGSGFLFIKSSKSNKLWICDDWLLLLKQLIIKQKLCISLHMHSL